MSLYEIYTDQWRSADALSHAADILTALGSGAGLVFSSLRFIVEPGEQRIFTPSILGGAKNASFDPRTGRLGSTQLTGPDADTLRGLMQRFSASAAALVDGVLPSYRRAIVQARASF